MCHGLLWMAARKKPANGLGNLESEEEEATSDGSLTSITSDRLEGCHFRARPQRQQYVQWEEDFSNDNLFDTNQSSFKEAANDEKATLAVIDDAIKILD
ncbi:hypothetical protein NDU88_012437 [Pleurodeles waltl]|uniref:Uncharacterized protein n=1 Tax=Pleurodeles waltl TaxID=8319 RepID=A0AAV7R4J8_PLEWA|nr:hypothetical protein NDU88_012437 [Pleurodeles waltl]